MSASTGAAETSHAGSHALQSTIVGCAIVNCCMQRIVVTLLSALLLTPIDRRIENDVSRPLR